MQLISSRARLHIVVIKSLPQSHWQSSITTANCNKLQKTANSCLSLLTESILSPIITRMNYDEVGENVGTTLSWAFLNLGLLLITTHFEM